MPEQTYADTLYGWISKTDPTFSERYTVDNFKDRVRDKNYTDALYKWIDTQDPTFKTRYQPDTFSKKLNPVTEESFFSKAWGSIAGAFKAPTYTPITNADFEKGIRRDFINPKRLTAEPFVAATKDAALRNKEDFEIDKERAESDVFDDTTPETILSAVFQKNGLDIKAHKGKLPETTFGQVSYDITMPEDDLGAVTTEIRALRAKKEAEDLIAKAGYIKDASGQYTKATKPTASPEEVQQALTALTTDLTKTLTQETNASLAQYSDNVYKEIGATGLPRELTQLYAAFKSAFPEVSKEDVKKLTEVQNTLASLKEIGNNLAAAQQLQPAVDIAKAGFIPAETDISDPEQMGAVAQTVEQATAAIKEEASAIISNPDWIEQQIVNGIEQTYAVDDASKKAALNKFRAKRSFMANPLANLAEVVRDPGMTDLESSEFFLKSAGNYKRFVEGNLHDSKAQLQAIEVQINELINVTKEKPLTSKGEEVLATMQVTRDALAQNVAAQMQLLAALNDGIKKKGSLALENQGLKEYWDDAYSKSATAGKLGAATRDVAKMVVDIPEGIYNLTENIIDATHGRGYKSQKLYTPSGTLVGESQEDHVPAELSKSIEGALSYDISSPNKSFSERFSVDPIGLFHTTLKVGVQSALLGGSGALAEGLGAKVVGAIAKNSFRNTSVGLAAAEATGSLGAKALGVGSRALAKGLSWGVDTGAGFIAPSVLMMGEEMVDNELKKGRTLDQAINIGVLRAAIEGLTEKINPFEMRLIQGKVFTEGVQDLGENFAFKRILLNAGLSNKAFNYLYKGGKATLKTGALETVEEEIGLFLNDWATRGVQSGDASYTNDEPFNLDNIVNTALMTMVTMAPQSVTSGIGAVSSAQKQAKVDLESLKYARTAVAMSPNLFKELVAEQFRSGKITKAQAAEAVERIERLEDAYLGVEDKVAEIENSPLTPVEKKLKITDLINSNLRLQELANVDASKMSEEELQDNINSLRLTAEHVQRLLQAEVKRPSRRGLEIDYSKLEDDREFVARLDADFSAARVNNTTDVSVLEGLRTQINSQLQRINESPSGEQPIRVKTRYETIASNIDTRLKALETGQQSEVSEANPQLLVLPSEKTAEPVESETPVAEATEPAETPETPTEQDVVTQEAETPVVERAEEAPETTPASPETKSETIPNVDKLMEMHATYASKLKKPLSFHRWLQTKQGQRAQQSLAVLPESTTVVEPPVLYLRALKNTANDFSDEDLLTYNQEDLESVEVLSIDEDGNITRNDGGITYTNNRLVSAATTLAYSSRDFEEGTRFGPGTHYISDSGNTLDPKFNVLLNPNGIKPETKLVARLTFNDAFVAQSKAQLQRYAIDLIAQGISREEIENDLNDPNTFAQIDIFEPGSSSPIGSVHVLSYINPARVVPEIEDSPNNLARNYRELKEFRAQLLDQLKASEEVPLVVTAKSNGFFFTEKDGKVQTSSEVFKNPSVRKTIQVVKNETTLNLRTKTTMNVAMPGGSYVIIPAANGKLFAWQLNPKKVTNVVSKSYLAAIAFYRAYKEALKSGNAEEAKKLRALQEEEGFGEYDLTSTSGLKTYLNNLVPSSQKTSDYTQDFLNQPEAAQQARFIDFNEKEGKITFSSGRSIPEEFLETDGLIDLPHRMYGEAGIYELFLDKPDPKVTALLAEHLSQRRLATNFASFSDYGDSQFKLPLIRQTSIGFERVPEDSAKQSFDSYKDYLLENTETPLLEHQINSQDFAYFQQPTIGFELANPVQTKPAAQTEAAKEVTIRNSQIENREDKKADIERRRQEELKENEKLRVQDLKTKVAEKWGTIEDTKQELKDYISNQFAEKHNLTEEQVAILHEFVNLGLENNPFIDIEEYTEEQIKKFDLKQPGKELNKQHWERFMYLFPEVSQKEIVDLGQLEDISGFIAREMKGALLSEIEGQSGLPDNLAELNAEKINAKYDAELAALEDENTKRDLEVPENLVTLQSNIEALTGEKPDITPLLEEQSEEPDFDDLFGSDEDVPPTIHPMLPTQAEVEERKNKCK